MKGFRVIPVKMPVLWKDWWFEDLAVATGAKVIDPVVGLPMKDATMEHLGRVGNILITRDDTYLDGIKDVTDHVASLSEDASDDGLLRVSRLNTKTARYFVGAHSDSALSYRRLKVEDAIGAAYQALNGGVVAGGGVSLRNCAIELSTEVYPEDIGKIIMIDALRAVEKQIQSNAGFSYEGELDENEGVDTRTKTVVNMFNMGIIDPRNVVFTAIKNAVSVASTVITAPTIVTLPRMEAQEMQQPPVIR